MPIVTATNPQTNEITFSAPSLVGVSTPRLGQAQREFTTDTIALAESIFFKFYECNDSTGTKVYTPLDVSSAFANATVMERFATMVFLIYYQNSSLVSELSSVANSFEPLSQRLGGVISPSTPLASSITMPAAGSNFVEFVSMGAGSFFGAGLINANSAYDGAASPWGTRVAQVHLTSTDPLGTAPIEALYDNTDTGCWKFSDFNCNGIIVYTNLFTTAFSAAGLSVWSQILCVFPLISFIKNAQYACVFNTIDSSFLRNGLGFFDRAARRDSFYGWSGNYILSIFNDWGIPVISPIWGISDIAIPSILHNTATHYLPFELDDSSILYRFIGPQAAENVYSIKEKTARSLFPFLWCSSCLGRSLSWLNTKTAALGYPTTSDYISACLGSTTEGYNAHIYQSILQSSFGGFPLSDVRSLVTNGVSWSGSLASQPSLADIFVDSSGNPYYYAPSIGGFFPGGDGTYSSALLSQIEIYTLDMSPAQEAAVEGWLYSL